MNLLMRILIIKLLMTIAQIFKIDLYVFESSKDSKSEEGD